MSIPKQQKREFEQVSTEDFVTGKIAEVQEDMEHTFTGKFEKIAPAVRFVFSLDGYEHKHFSRWMSFIYAERATLYIKYITSLVENPEPFMDFDVQELKGLKVKMLWKNDGEGWQSIETIRPIGGKVVWKAKLSEIIKRPQPNVITHESLSGKESFESIAEKVKQAAAHGDEDEPCPF